MESGDVSKMTARLIELVFGVDSVSRKPMSGSRWSLMILAFGFCVWAPVATGSLTGKVQLAPSSRSFGSELCLVCQLQRKENTVISN